MNKKHPQLVLVGSKIREIRNEIGISQEELAAKSGLARSYFGAVERGEKNIAALNLMRVAIALNVEVGDMFPSINLISKHQSQ